MPRLSNNALGKRYEQIRANLEYLKTHSGRSTDQIAEYIDICSPVLLKRMRDPRQLTLDNLDQLARLFNVPLDKILNGKPGLILDPINTDRTNAPAAFRQ